jgi:arylsulfatase A-like enzyme
MRYSIKKSRKWILPLVAAAALLMLPSHCQHRQEVDLIRIPFDREDGPAALSHQTADFSLQKADSYLYFKKPHKAVSIKGLPLGNLNPAKNISEDIIIEPRLKGNYYMDFYYLLMGPENKKGVSPLLIQHKRGSQTLKKIRLPHTPSFKRRQIPLALSAEDRIEFLLKEKEITVGVLGRPTFYRENRQEKKNFVFIVVADTLRQDRLGVYNPTAKCSPAVDRFARDAVIFDQAFSTSPWTLPAHMSLFTGLDSHVHGVNYGNEKIDPKIRILFEPIQKKFINYCLNANGYMSGLYGFARGFDFYEESFRDHRSRTASRDLFAEAKRLVQMEKHAHALFLLHTYQIHTPYIPEIGLSEDYYNRVLALDHFRRFRFNPIEFIQNGKELFKKVSDSEKAAIERIYEAGVYTFDSRFGEFIEFLKREYIYREAAIILISDHGEEFNDHDGWEHGHSLYNELIKIPLIVKFPQSRHGGKRVDIPVCITDVLPAIMEWYGIAADADVPIQGISLLEAVRGTEKARNRLLFSYLAPDSLRSGIPEKIAVISGNMKYIYQKSMNAKAKSFFTIPPPPLPNQMYDIFKDPCDTDNIRIRHRQEEKEFLKIIKGLKLKKGRKGQLKELEETLKSLGYL